MTETVKTIDLRNQLGHIMNKVAYGNQDYVITRRGRAIAAMISYERYLELTNKDDNNE